MPSPASPSPPPRLLAETKAIEIARMQCQAYKLAIFRIDTPEALARFGGKPPSNQRRDTDLDSHLARARAGLAPAGTASPPGP